MRITVIVATYGSREWAQRGFLAAAAVPSGADDVIPVHHSGTLANARNLAAAMATPGWLCFLDADDRLHPDFFSKMREKGSTFDGGFFKRHYLLVPSIQYGGSQAAQIPAWLSNLYEVNCAVIGTLIDRDLFHEIGGFRDTLNDGTPLTSLEDWEMWMRAVKHGAVMVPVPDAVYMARVEDRSDSGRRNSDQSPYEAIRAEHGDFDWGNVRAYKIGYPEMATS